MIYRAHLRDGRIELWSWPTDGDASDRITDTMRACGFEATEDAALALLLVSLGRAVHDAEAEVAEARGRLSSVVEQIARGELERRPCEAQSGEVLLVCRKP